jgi:hypothetical protein
MPESAAYGKAREMAIASGCPPGWSYCSLLAVHAGQGINLADPRPKPRPTIYVVLLGPPEDGKSLTMERGIEALHGEDALSGDNPAVNFDSPASAEAISDMFPRYPLFGGSKRSEVQNPLAAVTLAFDELTALVKACIPPTSKVTAALNTLFNKDFFNLIAVVAQRKIYIRLSIIGCLPAGNSSEFRALWGPDMKTGVASRAILVPGPEHSLGVQPRAQSPA